MHNYTRARLNTIYSNFFKQLIGYVQRRTSKGDKGQLPQVLTFRKYQKFLDSGKAIFQQNQNLSQSDSTYLAKIRILRQPQKQNKQPQVFGKTKIFVTQKRLRFEVTTIFLQRSPLFWDEN